MDKLKATHALRFLIVGGGTAGLSCAISLARAGHRVTVFEQTDGTYRSPEVQRCPPYMTRVLQRWGMSAERLVNEAETMWRSRFHDGMGELLQILEWAGPIHELGADYHLVQCGQLVAWLLELAKKNGAELRFNSKVVDVDPERAAVHLESGEVAIGDIVIGADGWNSTVRSVVTGGTPMPQAERGVAYSFLIPAEKVQEDPELADLVRAETFNFYMGDNCLLTGFYLSKARTKQYFLIYQCLSAEADDVEGQWDIQEAIEDLESLDLSSLKPALQRLLRLADKTRVIPYVTASPIESWVHESYKVILAGDAGEPSPPHSMHGAAAAIEDGMAIGTLFSHMRSAAQIPTLLSAYEEIRKPRAAELAEDELQITGFFSLPKGPIMDARNSGMRAAYESALNQWDKLDDDEGMRQLWDGYFRIAKTDAYEAVCDWWTKWGSALDGDGPGKRAIEIPVTAVTEEYSESASL